MRGYCDSYYVINLDQKIKKIINKLYLHLWRKYGKLEKLFTTYYGIFYNKGRIYSSYQGNEKSFMAQGNILRTWVV